MYDLAFHLTNLGWFSTIKSTNCYHGPRHWKARLLMLRFHLEAHKIISILSFKFKPYDISLAQCDTFLVQCDTFILHTVTVCKWQFTNDWKFWIGFDGLKMFWESVTAVTGWNVLDSLKRSWQSLIVWIGHGWCHIDPFLNREHVIYQTKQLLKTSWANNNMLQPVTREGLSV